MENLNFAGSTNPGFLALTFFLFSHTESGYLRRKPCSKCSMRTTRKSSADPTVPLCEHCEDPSNN